MIPFIWFTDLYYFLKFALGKSPMQKRKKKDENHN